MPPLRITLPVTPPVCEGRDYDIDRLVIFILASFCHICWPAEPGQRKPTPLIIHGEGGIGKSTIAMKVLVDSEVESIFCDRRAFVRCDGLKNADALLDHIVSALGLTTAQTSTQLVLFAYLGEHPTVVVLDNFEDLCPDGPVDGVEDLLAGISDRAQLVITKRGGSQLQLARHESAEILRLPLSAARSAFLAYVPRKERESVERDPALHGLLERLDEYPLAISLVARQVRCGRGPRELLQQYDAQRSTLLRHGGGDSRTNNLAVSVQLSLDNQLIRNTEGARETCFLLAHLPDGATRDLLCDAIFRSADPAVEVKAIAVEAAIAESGLASNAVDSELLRMAVPLREYFQNAETVDATEGATILEAASKSLSRLVGEYNLVWDPHATNLKRRRLVAIQLANLEACLARDLESENIATVESALQTSIEFTDFSFATTRFVPSSARRAIEVARLHQLHVANVDCSVSLAQLLVVRDFCNDAAEVLDRALEVVPVETPASTRAQCLRTRSWISIHDNDYEAAAVSLREAASIFKSAGDRSGEGACLLDRGKVAWALDDLDAADVFMKEALSVFESVNDWNAKASCLLQLGRVALARGDLDAAAALPIEALPIFKSASDTSGEAWCLDGIADAALARGDPDAAMAAATDALDIFRSIGHTEGESCCLETIAKARAPSLSSVSESLEGPASTHWVWPTDRSTSGRGAPRAFVRPSRIPRLVRRQGQRQSRWV